MVEHAGRHAKKDRENTPPANGVSDFLILMISTRGHPVAAMRVYQDVIDAVPYRGTSLTRNRTPLGPYSRPMRRVLGGS